jgi:hypothetical protein
MPYEYRVIYKREGLKPKRKRYVSLKVAERFVRILGPEPWEVFGKKADDRCCSGLECACGGLTERERQSEYMKDVPPLEYVRIERREVGKWTTP